MDRKRICANCERATYEAGLYRNERTCHRPDGTERLVSFDRTACEHFRYKQPRVKIIETGELETYEFYCNICGTRFQAQIDECDSCSRRADDYIREKKEEAE